MDLGHLCKVLSIDTEAGSKAVPRHAGRVIRPAAEDVRAARTESKPALSS